jgi:hypothetical protein
MGKAWFLVTWSKIAIFWRPPLGAASNSFFSF